jgi:hypothetical protein
MFGMQKSGRLFAHSLRRMAPLLIFVCAVYSCGPATTVRAAGGTLHIFMSELALDQVRDPELKQLLLDNRNVVLWASWYPDSGYAGGNTYGEYSHWTPFLDGYLDYIRDTVGAADRDFPVLTAHLMGAAAHSIQDQAFDHIFLVKTGEMDGHGQELLDFGLDLVCMADHGRHTLDIPERVYADPGIYTPVAHLGRVYELLGADFDKVERQIYRGQRLLAMAISGEKLVHTLRHDIIREQSPWAAAHYYGAPGGVLHNARITAAYWESLWKRLKGARNEFSVIDTFPQSGGAVLSANPDTVDADISVLFSRQYDKSTIAPDTFTVRDAAGTPVPGQFHWGYGSNLVRFRPAEPWPASQSFTVTLSGAIRDVRGDPLSPEYSFPVTSPAAQE